MVGVMVTSSKRTYASMLHLPALLRSVPLTLRQATVNPLLHQGLSLTGKSGSVCCEDTVLSPRSWYTQGLLCPPSFLSPVEVLKSNPLAFKIRVPGCSQFLCRIPSSGNLLWSSSGICFFLLLPLLPLLPFC